MGRWPIFYGVLVIAHPRYSHRSVNSNQKNSFNPSRYFACNQTTNFFVIHATIAGRVPANIAKFRKDLLNIDQAEFASKLSVSVELVQAIEKGETDIERVGRIFTALARLCEEPIFNFWRPGHHIDRLSLEELEEKRTADRNIKLQQQLAHEEEVALMYVTVLH